MKYKHWIIPKYDNNRVCALAHSLNISPILAKLLINRQYESVDKAEDFLKKDVTSFYSPFIMKDMEKGAKLLIDTIKNGKKILIWGDYDVDGVTSVTVLLKYIKSVGGICDYYIPKRADDGYGLNSKLFDDYAKDGVKLLITVDSGITAINEVEEAKRLGIKVVITDHHECREELPKADAVINPKRRDCPYPFKELAGVGVVFKFICAVESLLSHDKTTVISSKKIVEEYSDFIAIGTIADVMPISNENRVIVAYGLDLLENTKNIGLAALINESGIDTTSSKKKKISSTTIGFVLAPRINAAGRMNTSSIAVELFMTKSYEKAAQLAATLTATNKERQTIENEILSSALAKVESQNNIEKDKVIVLDDDNWHHGIIGIVSSRITEKFNLPSILISFKSEGSSLAKDMGKGSGRSIKGMNLVEALNNCSDLLEKFGGHELAAGLSVSRNNLTEFKKRINAYAEEHLDNTDLIKKLDIDCEITALDAGVSLANELSLLEPFGLSNPVPLFCTTGMKISSITSIGNGKHTKLLVEKGSTCLTALLFGTPITSFKYLEGDYVDVAYNLDTNNFRNQLTFQLIVRDIRPSKRTRDVIRQHIHKHKNMMLNDNYNVNKFDIPSRCDFTHIYTLTKNMLQNTENGILEASVPYMTKLLSKRHGYEIPIFRAMIVFDVLSDCNLLNIEKEDDVNFIIKESNYRNNGEKVILEESEIMKNLYKKSSNS